MSAENTEGPRPYVLRFESREGYLYAHVSGESDSVEISLEYAREIAKECQARNYSRVMVVEDLKPKLSILDTYTIAAQWSEICRGLVGAFVDLQGDHLQGNLFGESVAVNRGLSGRVFTSEAEAEKWLLSV